MVVLSLDSRTVPSDAVTKLSSKQRRHPYLIAILSWKSGNSEHEIPYTMLLNYRQQYMWYMGQICHASQLETVRLLPDSNGLTCAQQLLRSFISLTAPQFGLCI